VSGSLQASSCPHRCAWQYHALCVSGNCTDGTYDKIFHVWCSFLISSLENSVSAHKGWILFPPNDQGKWRSLIYFSIASVSNWPLHANPLIKNSTQQDQICGKPNLPRLTPLQFETSEVSFPITNHYINDFFRFHRDKPCTIISGRPLYASVGQSLVSLLNKSHVSCFLLLEHWTNHNQMTVTSTTWIEVSEPSKKPPRDICYFP